MIQTVDPKHTRGLAVMVLLSKLNITGWKRHRISAASSLTKTKFGNLPKPHWIQMAVISTTLDYIEAVPYKERDKDIS